MFGVRSVAIGTAFGPFKVAVAVWAAEVCFEVVGAADLDSRGTAESVVVL
jgi:hypothetical protein